MSVSAAGADAAAASGDAAAAEPEQSTAHSALAVLERMDATGSVDDIEGFHIRIATILRDYAERRFDVPAGHLTTQEVAAASAATSATQREQPAVFFPSGYAQRARAYVLGRTRARVNLEASSPPTSESPSASAQVQPDADDAEAFDRALLYGFVHLCMTSDSNCDSSRRSCWH